MARATILSADAPGDHLEVTGAEIAALEVAILNAAGTPWEILLIKLLSKLDTACAARFTAVAGSQAGGPS